MISKVILLHEYGAPHHFRALYHLQSKGEIREIEHIEFNIVKQIVKGIIYCNKKMFGSGFENIKKFLKLLKQKNQIIIIGAAPYDPIIPILLYLKKRNRLIYFTSWPYWGTNFVPKKIIYPLQKKMWALFILKIDVVTVTQTSYRAIRLQGANPVFIPHSVDTSLFYVNKIKRSKFTVLYVGRLVAEKGIFDLISLANNFKDNKNIEFMIVGDGPLKKAVQQSSDNIIYFGWVRDNKKMVEIYNSCDLLILLSKRTKSWEELFGIVLIEGMACGLPVIATDCVGPREIIKNNINGFIIPQDNKQVLINKLQILVDDSARRKKMGLKGREIAVNNYSLNKTSDQWLSFINQLP